MSNNYCRILVFCSCNLLLEYPVVLCLCFFICNFVSFNRVGINLVMHDKEHLWGLLLHLKQHNVFHTCSESVLELLQLNFRKIHDSEFFSFDADCYNVKTMGGVSCNCSSTDIFSSCLCYISRWYNQWHSH
jgi:hypothetical protein